MNSRNVPDSVVAAHLLDVMPVLHQAIHQALHEYTPAASPAVNAAIAGDTATLAQLRQQYRLVATVIPPKDRGAFRLKVEAYAGDLLHDYAWRYKLSAEQAQAYAGAINGALQKGA